MPEPAPHPVPIAVIGLGRAGRARVTALEHHPHARLAAVVRSTPGRGRILFASLLADPAIPAAIVCTPNLLHAEQIRALLQAGKHTAVEFPLAPTPHEARTLFALAREHGRVLHVEHIELLSAAQHTQRRRLAALGRPTGGTLSFSGGNGGWIGDPALGGSPALLALARLSRLVDLFGKAKVAAVTLEPRPTGHRLRVDLTFAAGGHTTLIEERGPDLPRTLEWTITCEHGLLDAPHPPAEARSLFRQDLDVFLDRIATGREGYVAEETIVHVLELVAAIADAVPRTA